MENLDYFREKLGIESAVRDYQLLQDKLMRLGKSIETSREELGINRQVIPNPMFP